MAESSKWDLLYDCSVKPSWEEISTYIDNSLWEELNDYLKSAYGIEPELCYSGCAAQRGWNVKYKKSSRSLCTLYPEDGSFIAMVVAGGKEETAIQVMMSGFSDYVKRLYETTRSMPMGRWLMIRVTNPEILEDVKTLIGIKVKPKA